MPMYRKYFLSGFLLFFILFTIQGQSGIIEGDIIDKATGDAIPFASLAVYSSNNSDPVLSSVSEENGHFRLTGLEHSKYILVISYVGYQSDTVKNIIIARHSPRWHIGTTELNVSPLALQEVEITEFSSTLNTKIDRKIYTAADFETASGGTAIDILNKLPSISVDPNGIVSVRGTPDFMVYLNGKPTYLDASMVLSQISGDAIKKIEVISIPTAKYDAQGKGGIINITTRKKGVEGLSLKENIMFGGAPWGNLTDPVSEYNLHDNRFASGFNLVYTKKDFSAYGGFYSNTRNVNGFRSGDARLLQADGSYFHMVAEGKRPEWYKNYSGNAGFDYNINETSDISVSYYYGKRNEGRSAFYVYNTFFGAEDKAEILDVPINEDLIYNPNTDNRYGLFQTTNIDYTTQLNNNSELKLSLLYEHSELRRELNNQNFDFNSATQTIGPIEEHFTQDDNTPLDGFRFSANYSTEMANGNQLGFGIQPSFLKIKGSFSYDTLGVPGQPLLDYTELENAIDLKRGIYASYIDYSGTMGNLKFIAGLRLEYTDQLMNIDNPDYFSLFERDTKPDYEVNKLDWFPSLHLEYSNSETTSLNLAASRRISRPPIKNMTPFLYRRHFEVYEVGDPALKPEYLTNLELSINKKLGKQNIVLTGFYRGTNNAVFRVNTIFEEENVLIRSYTNSGNTQAIGAELNANLQAGKIAKFFMGGSLYNYRIQGDIFGYQEDNNSLNWSFKTNMNLLISKSLKFTLDFDMMSATVTAQGKNELFYMSNSALSYSPKKLKTWNFNFKVLDILGSNVKGLNTRAFNAAGDQIFFQETKYLRYGPIAEFGISYDLNMNGKSGKKGDSEFGSEEF